MPFLLGAPFGEVQSLPQVPDPGMAAVVGRSKSLLTQKNVSCEFVVLFLKVQCTCR